MAAARFVVSGAILGLFCSGLPEVLLSATDNRCNSAPCSCDDYGRLTCDCKDSPEELILSSEGERRLSPNTKRVSVSNCRSVTVTNGTFATMDKLRSVDLENIKNLTLQPFSFEISAQNNQETRISIKNSSVSVLPSSLFRGNIETISFEAVRIGEVRAFAFANINRTESVRLENCRVDRLEAQAFKKFDVRYLHIIGCNLGEQLPSKTMNDIEVYEKFMLDGVRMGTVRSSAFIMKRPDTVAIQNCKIDSLESEAFDVSARGTVLISNNTIDNVAVGAFLMIRADRESRSTNGFAYDLIFKDNSLANFEEGSLVFDRASFDVSLDNVLVNQPCDCAQIPIWRRQLLNYSGIHLARLHGPAPAPVDSDDQDAFHCLSGRGEGVNFASYETGSCALGRSMLVLGLALGGAVLLLLVLGLLIGFCCRRKRRRETRKRWMSVPTSAPDVVSKKNGVPGKEVAPTATASPVDSRITMVVPDGRLYKETEFHVIVEKAEPLTTEL